MCIVNKSSYEKNNLNCINVLGVKGGGGQNQPSEQPSLQHLAVSLKINVGQILVKSTTNPLFENVHKYCPFLL